MYISIYVIYKKTKFIAYETQNRTLRFPEIGKVPSEGLRKWGLKHLSHPNNDPARELSNVIIRRRVNFCSAKS